MARLRQAEAGAEKNLDGDSAGLEAMRGALEAVAATPSPMEAAPSPSWAVRVAQGWQGEAARAPIAGWQASSRPPGIFVFGSTRATPEVAWDEDEDETSELSEA